MTTKSIAYRWSDPTMNNSMNPACEIETRTENNCDTWVLLIGYQCKPVTWTTWDSTYFWRDNLELNTKQIQYQYANTSYTRGDALDAISETHNMGDYNSSSVCLLL